MTRSIRFVVRRWWWSHFHPLARFGWMTATAGRSRSATQTVVGIGLVGAGLILKRSGRRKVLYRGTIKPGTSTKIRVYRGRNVIHDGSIGG